MTNIGFPSPEELGKIRNGILDKIRLSSEYGEFMSVLKSKAIASAKAGSSCAWCNVPKIPGYERHTIVQVLTEDLNDLGYIVDGRPGSDVTTIYIHW